MHGSFKEPKLEEGEEEQLLTLVCETRVVCLLLTLVLETRVISLLTLVLEMRVMIFSPSS